MSERGLEALRSIVLVGTRQLELCEKAEPSPGPGEVKVRVSYTGICGSEVHAYLGTHPFRRPPAVLGHELSGVVVEIGHGVMGVETGARVTVEPQIPCGSCAYCKAGDYNLCSSKVVLGTTSWPGSFGQYVVVPVSTVVPLPEMISLEVGATVEPLAVGIHAVRLARPHIGDSAFVLGSGTIGLVTIAALKAAGISPIIASDIEEFNLTKALEMGATEVVHARKEDVVARVHELTGGLGTHYSFITVGVPTAIQTALDVTRRKGTVVVIALFESAPSFTAFSLVSSERQLVGSQMYTREDFQAAVNLLATKRVDTRPLITHRFSIEEYSYAFEVAANRVEPCAKVMFQLAEG